MSLDEARRVTTMFAGRPMLAPPRTTDDILTLLATAEPEATHERATAVQIVATQPRAGAPPSELADFFLYRGRSALGLGRGRDAVADLTEAARQAERAGKPNYLTPIFLSYAYSTGSSNHRALELTETAIRAVPSSDQGHLFGLYLRQVVWYSNAGDVVRAEQSLAPMESLLAVSQRWPVAGSYHAHWAGLVSGARGFIHTARGQMRTAEDSYRTALRHMDRYPEPRRVYGYDVFRASLADVLAQRGALVEAETEARQALQGALRRNGRESTETGTILISLIRVVAAQGRHREAEQLAAAAIDIQEAVALPDSLLLALAREERVAALAAQARWVEAAQEFESIERALAKDSISFRRFFGMSLERPLALVHSGRASLALPMILEALERLTVARGDNDIMVGAARGVYAVVLRHLGERDHSIQEFRRGVAILQAASSIHEDRAEAARGGWLRRLIVDEYIDLLWELDQERAPGGGEGAPAREAFRLIDLGRSRVVQRAFVAAGLRTATDPALRDLIRREQDAAQQLSGMHGAIANQLGFSPANQNVSSISAVRREIQLLTQARTALIVQIERQAPGYLRRLDPPVSAVSDVQAVLRPGEALIAVHTTGRRTYVWAVPEDGAVVFRASALRNVDVATLVRVVRHGLEPGRTTADIRPFDVSAAHRLYVELLEPVRSAWGAAQVLFVVADTTLGSVPFGLLPSADTVPGPDINGLFSGYRRIPWLITSHAVTHLPSVATLQQVRTFPAGDPKRRPFIGFGDPIFSAGLHNEAVPEARDFPGAAAEGGGEGMVVRGALRINALQTAQQASLPRLPETAEELRLIGAVLGADPERDVILGLRATETAVTTTDLSLYRVIAFATHGLAAGDLDGLDQPALVLTSPEVAGVDGDGLLTMEEIMRLRLDADWVVLSACNSAGGSRENDEAISGLGRAFFYSGSRAILVTAWPVETTSARALTTTLFQRHASGSDRSRSSALQSAMVELIERSGYVAPSNGSLRFTYAHPIFWAPFMLVGDGGL